MSAIALFADISALILVISEIRATIAAYAVYGVAAALSIVAGIFIIAYRKELKSVITDTIVSTALVTSLRKYDAFEKALTDYGWRNFLTAIAVPAWNIVYVSYLIWMAVAYKSPWYAALAGFYAWLVIIRGGIVSADKYVESRKYPANNKEKYKIVIALIGGIALISAGIAISAPIAQMAVGTYPKSGGIFNIVVNSVFALFKCVSSTVNCVRSVAYKDPVTRGLRNITMVTALMSVLTLQISVIAALELGSSLWKMITAVGSAISVTITIAGIASTVRNARALKKLSKKNALASDAHPERDDATDEAQT